MKKGILFTHYVWIINTIYNARRISLEDLNERWCATDMSDGHPFSRASFYRHKESIQNMLGINILCDTTDDYRYYIEDRAALRNDGIMRWVLDSISVGCIISEARALHDRISTERIRNQKAYVIDTGLQGNRENVLATENLGWKLENVVYIELLRRCAHDFMDVYYYKPSPRAKEVDFVLCDQNKAVELIQVAYEIDGQRAYEREMSSLIKASQSLACNRLTLITFSQTRDVELDGKTIHIVSALDWLLSADN